MKSGFSCSKDKLVPSGVPHLRPFNIQLNLQLDTTKLFFIPANLNNEIWHLKKNDILFNNTNSIDLVGKAAILKEDFVACYSNHITRIRTNDSIISAKWLAFYFHFCWLNGTFRSYCRKWIGQVGISSQMIKELEIPVPPLEIQNQIISKLERLLSLKIKFLNLKNTSKNEVSFLIPRIMTSVFNQQFEELYPCKQLSDCFKKAYTGSTPPNDGFDHYSDIGIPFIKVEHIQNDGSVLIDTNIFNHYLNETDFYRYCDTFNSEQS